MTQEPRKEPAQHRASPRLSRGRLFGYGLIGVGALLATFAVAYLVYTQVAIGGLDELEATVPEQVRGAWLQPPSPANTPVATVRGPATPTPPGRSVEVTPTQEPGVAGRYIEVRSLYPASQTNPKYWDAPLWAGSSPYGGPGLPEGFEFTTNFDAARGLGALSEARNISIPAIGLESEIRELVILDLGKSRAYETPAHVVGHIPGTANPGENGNGWFFGHLESPFVGEGNVFYRLPDIPGLIKEDPVDVIVASDTGAFLYRVTSTRVVHEDDMSLYKSPVGTITLVACVPSRVYDHRLLVTAELIAERR